MAHSDGIASRARGRSRAPRRTRFAALTTAATFLLLFGACDGDTLFDEEGGGEGTPPTVQIRAPQDGQQILAGRQLQVSVFASDAVGVTQVVIDYSGVVQGQILRTFSPAVDSIVVDTIINVPAGVNGTLELRASARNTLGVVGRTASAVRLSVSGTVPSVSLDLAAPPRAEVDDSVKVTVAARTAIGGSNIARLGMTALVLNTTRTDTLVIGAAESYSPPRQGLVSREFAFTPSFVDSLALPDTLLLEVHAFAVDSAGRCTAAISGQEQGLECAVLGADTVALGSTGSEAQVIVVTGRTVVLPDGGVIADAAVDTLRRRLYLSNFTNNRLNILDLGTSSFLPGNVLVGSQPWGLFMNNRQDTLIVANSGGTNLSFVSLGGTPREDTARRLLTPNAVLYQVRINVDETGIIRYLGTFIDYSDRPQFIAQDSTDLILYSTVPTAAASDGTIRFVDADPDPLSTQDLPEVRILFTESAIRPNPDAVAIAHVDSLKLFTIPGNHDLVQIFDHVPGYPDSLIQSDIMQLEAAIAQIRDRGSDIFDGRGTWNLDDVGMSDTTFVAASGDRGFIAFGEGAVGPAGRIILWNAAAREISNQINVADLVSNASERVLGVGLNLNGSMGMARGASAAYFFTNDLRLQGRFSEGIGSTGAGATLHPYHDQPFSTGANNIAFIGTGAFSIKVVNTFHFFEAGEIHIRDNIVGPLRAVPPLPADNAGLACPGSANCVRLKLYGITDAGGVVIVNVRNKDIQLTAGPPALARQ